MRMSATEGSWSGCGFLALVAPLHVAAPRVAIENPRGDEQQIGQAIQVTARVRADLVFLSERDHAALGAPAHRARKVRARGGARAAWQDELLERRQTCVPGFEPLLETRDLRIAEQRVARDAQLAAEVEQVVLDFAQRIAQLRRQLLREEHRSEASRGGSVS